MLCLKLLKVGVCRLSMHRVLDEIILKNIRSEVFENGFGKVQGHFLTRKEQKKMNETKYGIAMLMPHVFVPRLLDAGSHSLPSMHANMICCQLSPVAHLSHARNNDCQYCNHQIHTVITLVCIVS